MSAILTLYSNSGTDKNISGGNVSKDFEGLYENAEDILNTSRIIQDICKKDDGMETVKIRPLAELINKKADKMCIKIMNLDEQN